MGNYTKTQKKKIINSICLDVIENSISFNQAVKNSPISRMTFYTWISTFPELDRLYNYARTIRSDVLFEEIIEIADTTEEGVKTKFSKKFGIETETGDMTDHRRLKIDARKWVVAKMQPKKYGNNPEEVQEKNELTVKVEYVKSEKEDSRINKK